MIYLIVLTALMGQWCFGYAAYLFAAQTQQAWVFPLACAGICWMLVDQARRTL